ncbi:hypothetical protein Cgig2_024353 [Carnegiea gigantea]|uniref:Uncharacterized protein n=1 Tax=Carnegiea gigantea TaxID=171969 RepID=A0A9Q1K2P5_9CARY|nr:hypothetical protein Cgig2_024353 [Carnegiea gigantea]
MGSVDDARTDLKIALTFKSKKHVMLKELRKLEESFGFKERSESLWIRKRHDDNESMINSSKKGMIYFSNAKKLKSCIRLSHVAFDLLTRGPMNRGHLKQRHHGKKKRSHRQYQNSSARNTKSRSVVIASSATHVSRIPFKIEEAPGLVNTYRIATASSAAEQEGSSYSSVYCDPASWLKMLAITTNSSEALLVYFSKYNRDVVTSI